MKRQAFKELVLPTGAYGGNGPNLRLVGSNPAPRMAETKQAA